MYYADDFNKQCSSATLLKDSYGNVAWQQSDYPVGENKETQETQRLWLTYKVSKTDLSRY